METTEFQIGDVVRCIEDASGLRLGREYTIAVTDRAAHCQLREILHQGWFYQRRFELVRRAPASPAQEAPAQPTLPRPGQTWRVKNPESDDFGKTVTINLVSETHVHYDWLPPERLHNCTRRLDHFNECFEPAPSAPSESAAKQDEPKRMTFRERLEQTRASAAIQHSPYQGNDLDLEAQHARLTQQLPANQAARKRNIAALARELDQPSAERRARLHPHEGRSDRVYLANRRG